MRRPLKPFVTEYKGSNRRILAAPTEPGAFESERPAPRPFDFAARPDMEDSYDAAMRAADALFSIPAVAPPKPADPPRMDDVPRPQFDEQPHEPAPPEKTVGRILRVIDEAPLPEYVALEAEHTPKRRGRKPGSKNKPKVAPVPVAAVAHVEMAAAPPPPTPPRPRGRRPAAAPVVPAIQSIAAIAAEACLTAVVSPTSGTAQLRGEKRFAWARDKLKPGEDWKRRRLPRVCW